MENKFSVMRAVGSHAVMQADCENTVFGYAPASSEIKLEISDGTSLAARANENGRWELTLPPFAASLNKYELAFSNGGEMLVFSDVMFGEVFHISGQSNMELPMSRTFDPLAPEEFPSCEYIREFRVPLESTFGKDEEYEDFRGGEWKTATPENVPDMSGAGFWFAMDIYGKYGVPVGLLNTSAGGAAIEGRMPYKMLKELGWYDEFLAEATAPGYMENTTKEDNERLEKRTAELDSLDKISDKVFGDTVCFEKCSVPLDINDLPGLEGFCGRIWFRKSFELPAGADLTDAQLILGTMTDADRTYLNGELAGETTYMYPPRIYPAKALKIGTNTLHICLDVQCAKGGLTKDKPYCVKLRDRIIGLSGEWEYAVAAQIPWIKGAVYFPILPLAVYGAMTAPAFSVKCRAVLWYQGETNCNHPERYHFLFGEMVRFFRERYGYDVPVIATQLCNFDDPFAGGSDCWAELRQAQLECLDVPGTDMAVTIDVGEDNDLHPRNKRAVGERLALCARRLLYGDKTVPSDIFCESANYLGNGRIRLSFTDNSRVRLDDSRPDMFEIITGEERLPAQKTELTENGVILSFASDKKPDKVRCEWRNAPAAIVLRTAEGLPLSPFEVKVTE